MGRKSMIHAFVFCAILLHFSNGQLFSAEDDLEIVKRDVDEDDPYGDCPTCNEPPKKYKLQRRKRSWGDLDEDTLDDLWATFGGGRSQGRSRSRARGHRHRHGSRDEAPIEDGQERSAVENQQENRDRNANEETTKETNVDRRQGGSGRNRSKNRRRGNKRRRQHHQPTLPLVFPGHEDVTTPMPQTTTVQVEEKRGNSNRRRRPGRGRSGSKILTKARKAPSVLTGQVVRLRGGDSVNEGRVEVFVDGRFGVICDDHWELEDAHVVCKQLGFKKGALAAVGGAAYGTGDFNAVDIVMDEVQCNGGEDDVRSCQHSAVHDCDVNEAASVQCIRNDGCEEGWISGHGLCYRLMTQFATFDRAQEKCNQMDAHLLTIENQRESDFISDWLLAVTNETYLFTAGRKVTQDSNEYWKWAGTLYHVAFTKWFPGFPPSATSRQPSNHTGQNCITLSRLFYDQQRQIQDVKYYFMNDAPCTVRLPFVCEKLASFSQECYTGNGATYRGEVFRSDRGTLCQKWTESPKINPQTHPDKGLGDHNYCRNPDNDVHPWCWVNVTAGSFGYCALPDCDSMNATTAAIPTVSISSYMNGTQSNSTVIPTTPSLDGNGTRTCPPGNFHCHSSTTVDCIPNRWRCDQDTDCPNGEDERDCENPVDMFRKVSYHKLIIADHSAYSHVTYARATPEKCADQCLDTRRFVCRSFVYDKEQRHCTLWNVNLRLLAESDDNRLVEDENFHYYELVSQSDNCTGERFLCNNGKCIAASQVCNRHDDCNDFSDEQHCGGSGVEIRLVGGNSEHEGRVEVKYLGEWGLVCDDHWDLEDAEVVCKQLGYQGAVRPSSMSEFGGSDGNFLLDEVECTGLESSIEDCKHSPWRTHDCHNYEAAGAVCKVGKVCNPEKEFQCKNSLCVPTLFVCDNDDDCNDNSDEKNCEDIHVELVGGQSSQEGRVEIVRNGVRGTICDDDWDQFDAAVVCRMLGISGYAEAVTGGVFGGGSGVIWLDNVACRGDEDDIDDCIHAGWSKHNCAHLEDAGVRCGLSMNSTSTTTVAPTTQNSVPDIAPSQPTCGYRPIGQMMLRIVGGFQAAYGAYPWQVGVWKRGYFGGYTHWCGGTIIDKRTVLTAAHCYYGDSKENFRVTVGNHDNTKIDQFESQPGIEEIILHEDYSRTTHDYDVAMIKLSEDIQFNNHVQPACLPDLNAVYEPGKKCYISGWGRTGDGSAPNVLRAAHVPLISDTVCRELYKYSTTDQMFCAGYREGNIDSCQGDSGGPLVCHINGAYTVLGVTSWGNGCAQPNSPGVYTKVSQLVPWINRKSS